MFLARYFDQHSGRSKTTFPHNADSKSPQAVLLDQLSRHASDAPQSDGHNAVESFAQPDNTADTEKAIASGPAFLAPLKELFLGPSDGAQAPDRARKLHKQSKNLSASDRLWKFVDSKFESSVEPSSQNPNLKGFFEACVEACFDHSVENPLRSGAFVLTPQEDVDPSKSFLKCQVQCPSQGIVQSQNEAFDEPRGAKAVLLQEEKDAEFEFVHPNTLTNSLLNVATFAFPPQSLSRFTDTTTSAVEFDQSPEAFYAFVIELKALSEQEVEKQKAIIDDTKQNILPNASEQIEKEAIQTAVAWNKLARKLRSLTCQCGTTSWGDQYQTKLATSLDPILGKMQKLIIAKKYLSSLKTVCELLDNAKSALTHQRHRESLEWLSQIPKVVQAEALVGGRWLFQTETRQFISHKIKFFADMMTHTFFNDLSNSLEDISWGSLSLNPSLYQTKSDELQSILRSVVAVQRCQRLYIFLNRFQLDSIEPDSSVDSLSKKSLLEEPSNIVWASAILASFVIARFRIFFCRTNSPLCRLDHGKQPFRYISNIVRSHCEVLFSCVRPDNSQGSPPLLKKELSSLSPIMPHMVLNSSTAVTTKALQSVDKISSLSQFDAVEIVSGFLDLLCIEFGRFVSDRAQKLNQKKYQILLTETLFSHKTESKEVGLLHSSQNSSQSSDHDAQGLTSFVVSELKSNMIDELLLIAEEIAAISPNSIKYIFVTPDPPNFTDELSPFLLNANSNVFPSSKVDGLENFAHDVTLENREESCTNLNCLDILTEADSKRLMDFLAPHLCIPTASLTSVLMQTVTPPHALGMPQTKKTMRTYKVSESLRLLIEAIQLCESRVSALTMASSSGTGALETSFVFLKAYSTRVYAPAWKRMRIILRDTWNAIEFPVTNVDQCCLILDSYQLGLDFLQSELYAAGQFLDQEILEWERMRDLTMTSLSGIIRDQFNVRNLVGSSHVIRFIVECNCVKDLIVVSLAFRGEAGVSRILTTIPSLFKQFALQKFIDVAETITMDVCRAQLLNEVSERIINELFRFLDIRVNVLSAEHRALFAANCQTIWNLVDKLENFTPCPDLLMQLVLLQDFIRLQQIPSADLYSVLSRLDDLLLDNEKPLENTNSKEIEKTQFLGVQLVVGAEELFKSSLMPSLISKEEEMKAPKVFDLLDSAEIRQILHNELKVSQLSGAQCFEILRKRKEFCFASNYKNKK